MKRGNARSESKKDLRRRVPREKVGQERRRSPCCKQGQEDGELAWTPQRAPG